MMASLLTLIAATVVLVAIPGPNVALVVATSLKYGFRSGAVTVLGTTAGVGLQLALVVFGLATLVEVFADALTWIRWAGVVYLFFLGFRAWREPPADLQAVEAMPAVFWRGLLLAVLNPKTLLFNAAFIPQFAAGGPGTILELGLVATVFLLVLMLGDLLWAAFATSARPLLVRYAAARNRVSGAFMVTAGIGLALARR
jgi:threonine/homoserine/homoserine lactone efflux protein